MDFKELLYLDKLKDGADKINWNFGTFKKGLTDTENRITSKISSVEEGFNSKLSITQSDVNKLKTDSSNYISGAKSILLEAQRVNEDNEDVQSQLNDLIIESGNPNAEVSQARGGFDLLNSRLDNSEGKLDELRMYTLTKSNLLNDGQKEKKALVSFIADDAPTNDLTKLIPIVQEKNFPIALAAITKHVGTSNFQNIPLMSWSKLHELRATGLVEVIGHTHEHRNSTQLSPEVLEEDIRNCKMTLLANGIDTDCFVYPYNAYNDSTKAIVKKYFKYSFGRYNPPNIMSNTPIDNNAIHRVSLGSYYDIASTQFTEQDTSSLAYYKEQVDKAIERKDWLVFVLHTHTTNFEAEQQQHLRDVVDYIRSKGVDIVFPSKGAEIYANTLQIDGVDGTRTLIDAAGQASGTYFTSRIDIINGHKATDHIDKFEVGKITITPINSSEASSGNYPNSNGGILTTHKYTDSTSHIRQTYEPVLIYGGITVDSPKYTRYWLNDSWTAWEAERFKSAKTVSIVGLVSGQTWETPLAIAGITDRHTVNVTVDSSTPLPDGVIMDVVTVSTDSIRIRLANIKSTSSSSTSIKFLISATK